MPLKGDRDISKTLIDAFNLKGDLLKKTGEDPNSEEDAQAQASSSLKIQSPGTPNQDPINCH